MDTISLTLQNMLVNFLEMLPNLIAALVIFIVSLYLAGLLTKIIARTFERRNTERELSLLIVKIARWAVIITGTVIALQQIGFDLSAFLAGLGILGFTIGFALQDVSKNFISGILLLIQQPFNIGDIIQVGDFIGSVADVDLRATEIYTFDGQNVLIPNGDVFTSPIKNYSRFPKRRVDLSVGVAYGSDLDQVRRATLEAIANIQGVLPDPAPMVVFNNFGDSSIDLTVYFWIDLKRADYLKTIDAGIVNINAAFAAKGIEIPFPVRTLYVTK